MTQFYRYRNVNGAATIFSVDLGNEVVRLGDVQGFTEMAEHLQAGTCTVIFDDPDADVGHSGDAILGLQRFEIDETEAASGNRRLYSAIIGERRYRRRADAPTDSLRQGASREIEVQLHDLNFLVSKRIIPQSDRTAIRPRESVDERMAWILASDYMGTVVDNGKVHSNSTMLTKTDYRGQRAANVIGDCELGAGFGWNAFVYWDEAASEAALFFQNANTSTDYTSTLRLTNVFADADAWTDPSATTFIATDIELSRSPDQLGSHVFLPYRNGAVYRSRDATVDVYGHKDIAAPNANVSKRDRAREIADDFLFQHRNEEDRITLMVELPPSHVNLLRHGHRVQVKFQHLPGYEDWTWCRVTMRSPGQTKPTDDRYFVRLELSPQEPGCSEEPELVQWTYADADDVGVPGFDRIRFSLDADSTIGNLLVLAWLYDGTQMLNPETPDGWNLALDFEMQNSTDFNCMVYWKKSAGEDHVDVDFFDITLAGGRGVFMEWSGLASPALYAAATTLRQTALGYASIPATAYPSGALVLIDLAFMRTGPEDPDVVTATGTGHSMLIPWDVDWDLTLVNAGIAVGGMTRDRTGTSGTTPLYPAAGGWRLLATNDEPTVAVGLVFTGDNC